MEIQERLDRALDEAIAHLHAHSGTIHLKLPGQLVLQLRASRAIPDPVLAVVATVPWGKGMAGLAAERAQPVDACNIQTTASGDVRPGARATGVAGAIVVFNALPFQSRPYETGRFVNRVEDIRAILKTWAVEQGYDAAKSGGWETVLLVEDEDAVGRIGRHARDLAESDLARQLRPTGHRPIGRHGRRWLRGRRLDTRSRNRLLHDHGAHRRRVERLRPPHGHHGNRIGPGGQSLGGGSGRSRPPGRDDR